jgi:hypothetical protein
MEASDTYWNLCSPIHTEGSAEAAKALLADLEALKSRLETGDPNHIEEGFIYVCLQI